MRNNFLDKFKDYKKSDDDCEFYYSRLFERYYILTEKDAKQVDVAVYENDKLFKVTNKTNNMVFKNSQSFTGKVAEGNVTIKIKDVSYSNSSLTVDLINADSEMVIQKGTIIGITEFKLALESKKYGYISDLKQVKKNEPICIGDVRNKNGQIEDDGAYTD